MTEFEIRKSRYREIISKCDDFEVKGKNNLYTSANGHMFSQFNKSGELGIRFSKEVQEKYFEEYSTTQFLSYGAKMRGYIVVTERMWEDEDLMVKLLQEAYKYVMSLPSK